MADDGHAQDGRDGHPSRVPVSRPATDPDVGRGPGDGRSDVPAGALRDVLLRSRELGFLGPGEIDVHVRNAEAFLAALPPAGSGGSPLSVVDLGSGGGVPGLVLAAARDDLRMVLLDAAQKRTDFLTWAVGELGLDDRVSVARGRAEELARHPELRGRFDVVTARSFGPPAVTAECAVGFLTGPGSLLLVSEPPGGDPDRWPAAPLAGMGLRPGPTSERNHATVRVIEAVTSCPDELPRRVGVPARRPRF